jgi:hypothetical protein
VRNLKCCDEPGHGSPALIHLLHAVSCRSCKRHLYVLQVQHQANNLPRRSTLFPHSPLDSPTPRLHPRRSLSRALDLPWPIHQPQRWAQVHDPSSLHLSSPLPSFPLPLTHNRLASRLLIPLYPPISNELQATLVVVVIRPWDEI